MRGGGQAQVDRVIFLLLCPWLLFPGNPAESHNWDKPSAPPPPPRADKDGPSLLSAGFSRLLPVPTRRTLEGAGGRPEADWDAGVVSGLPSVLPTEKQTRRETRPPSPDRPDGKRNFSSADGSVLPSANRGACGNIWKAERTGC